MKEKKVCWAQRVEIHNQKFAAGRNRIRVVFMQSDCESLKFKKHDWVRNFEIFQDFFSYKELLVQGSSRKFAN